MSAKVEGYVVVEQNKMKNSVMTNLFLMFGGAVLISVALWQMTLATFSFLGFIGALVLVYGGLWFITGAFEREVVERRWPIVKK